MRELISEEAVPISLYLKLEKGQFADWEVVSRASIELIAAIRELAAFADPTLKVEIALQEGKEGSLRLNTLFRLVFGSRAGTDPNATAEQKLVLRAIIAGATIWLLQATAGHYWDKILDLVDAEVVAILEQMNGAALEGHATEPGRPADDAPAQIAPPAISPEDKAQITKILEGASRNGVGKNHIRKFYAEIQRDQAIEAVGIATGHDRIPEDVVPREQFLARSKEPASEPESTSREHTDRVDLLLVQPRLLGDNKAWRFSIAGLEFAAKVADKDFVERLLSGKTRVQMVEGVHLTADMRIEEEKQGEAWIVKSRTVVKVYVVKEISEQTSFFAPADEQEEGGADD